MGYVYAILVLTTVVSLWYRASRNLKAQGRGWFMQHWLGSILGGFTGAMQAFMFSSESLICNVLAVALTIGSILLARSPLLKRTT